MGKIFRVSDNTIKNSLSHRFRAKRFLFFSSLLNKLQRPLTILDVGGTENYWQMMGFTDPEIDIVLLNLTTQQVTHPQFKSIAGDATHLVQFANQSVDLIYSNSVIEHLYSADAQQKMANEIRRVGRNYFIQTPNYYFFIEPHWVFPFFQFLPFNCKVWLTTHFRLGHIGKIADREKAERQVKEIRLLTVAEMRKLFPEARIYTEKFFGFTKSIVAYHFPDQHQNAEHK